MAGEGEQKRLIEKDDIMETEEIDTTELEENNERKEDENADEMEEYDPDNSARGPIKARSCTDVLCLGRQHDCIHHTGRSYIYNKYCQVSF